IIDQTPNKENGKTDLQEKISAINAYKSLRQLINDLGETILRCYSIQNFLTTSLFLFCSCNELTNLQENTNEHVKVLGGKLLRNYIASAILTDLHIKNTSNLVN